MLRTNPSEWDELWFWLVALLDGLLILWMGVWLMICIVVDCMLVDLFYEWLFDWWSVLWLIVCWLLKTNNNIHGWMVYWFYEWLFDCWSVLWLSGWLFVGCIKLTITFMVGWFIDSMNGLLMICFVVDCLLVYWFYERLFDWWSVLWLIVSWLLKINNNIETVNNKP
jgi:hypothetical protein